MTVDRTVEFYSSFYINPNPSSLLIRPHYSARQETACHLQRFPLFFPTCFRFRLLVQPIRNGEWQTSITLLFWQQMRVDDDMFWHWKRRMNKQIPVSNTQIETWALDSCVETRSHKIHLVSDFGTMRYLIIRLWISLKSSCWIKESAMVRWPDVKIALCLRNKDTSFFFASQQSAWRRGREWANRRNENGYFDQMRSFTDPTQSHSITVSNQVEKTPSWLVHVVRLYCFIHLAWFLVQFIGMRYFYFRDWRLFLDIPPISNLKQHKIIK